MPVHLEIAEFVATLTLDDVRRRNVMTVELGAALADRVAELKNRRDVRAVVLTGAGSTFSAGGDLAMLESLRKVSFEEARQHMSAFYARYLSILDLEVPVIAAVEGAAIGAGLCVALACDVTLVETSTKLAFNFVQLGLHPGMGATYLVARRTGPQRAAELLFSGRRFDGREAVSLGLALEATEPQGVVPHARKLALQMAANAPLAVRALKRAMAIDRQALNAALAFEAAAQAESYGSVDLGEGLRAAVERRAPRFEGR